MIESALHGSRQPILNALAALGYQCGPEQAVPNDLPMIGCTFDGATQDEGVLMYAAKNDFRGVAIFTYDQDRIAAFLDALATDAIKDEVLQDLEAAITISGMPDSFCPRPCEVTSQGPTLGKLEARVWVGEDLLLAVALQEIGF